MNIYAKSDKALQIELGERLQNVRLNANMSQQELADVTGLSRNTIVNAETGKSCTLGTLIAMLRGLQILEQIEAFIPNQPASPIQLAKLHGKRRQRATGNRQTNTVSEDATPWTWGE